jgi:hypothetical protein
VAQDARLDANAPSGDASLVQKNASLRPEKKLKTPLAPEKNFV